MRRLLAAGACAAALALGGCGGSDTDTASTSTTAATTTTAPATTQATAPRPSQQGAGGQKKTHKHSQANSSPDAGNGSAKQSEAPVKPPPISSRPVAGTKAPAPGVKTVPGADDSVQTYGVESDSSERTEATIALAAYLEERRRKDWAGACEALAQRPREQLEKLAKSLSAQGKDVSGCAAAMAALGQAAPGSPQPPATTITEVLSLRTGGDVSGDPSYLIFTGPPAKTLYSMPMYLEGGWKVGLAVPAELPL
jgi:hypothetical protein